jgi:murein DD-endopeptidase MepM/ murein hydrolase activator NlpD
MWRRVGAQLVWVATALICTSGGEPDVGASAPPVFAIVEPKLSAPEPPRITVAPAPSITARVLADGQPVADAEVSISDGSKPLLATAKTDRDGVVKFADLEPGAYELWASHEAKASAIARVMDVAVDSKIDIELDRPAVALRGRVVVDGELPAEASVQLVPMDVDHALRVATVDGRGEFGFAALPYGRWRVEVTAPGHVQLAEQVVTVSAMPEELVVRMQRTGVVIGTVLDPSGQPVANATIVLRDQAGTAMQRPITLTASRLRWVHPLAGARVIPENDSSRFAANRPGTRPAECGRGHCGIDLVQPRGSIVHAVGDGQIVALFHESRGEAGRTAVVHHGGGLKSFYMHLDEVRPGLVVGQAIRAGDPVGTLGSTGFTNSVPHLHFAITHESIGRTWYLDPEPMIRAAVVLPNPRPYDPVDVAVAAKAELGEPIVTEIRTDAKGGFRIADVAPGSYVAAAFAVELAPGVSAPFTVRTGEDVKDVTIRLTEGVLVQGRVMGRDGPIAGATVFAQAGMGETAHKIATAHTDKYGEYTLRSVGGKITLAASAASYGDAERAISVIEGRSHPREDFKLTIEDGQLRGVVLAPDGGAAAGVSVRVVEGITRRRTASDAFGRFTIAPVTSGRYVVELTSPEYPPKRVTIDSQRFAELRLEAGGGARALIRDGHSGQPLGSVRVEASGPGRQSMNRTTDAQGTALLRGLAVGDWRLSVRAPGYLAASRTVTVRAGRGLQDTAFDLVRGATVAGEVRDRFGRRVAGARVSLGDVSTVTDGEGTFRLTGVESGTLEADSDGRTGAVELRLSPGDERLSITVNLSE